MTTRTPSADASGDTFNGTMSRPSSRTLTGTVSTVHAQIELRLGAAAHDPPIDSVVWLAAHLAAFQRTVLVAGRAAGLSPCALSAITQRIRILEADLRTLERYYSGDGTVSTFSARDARTRLLDDWTAERAAETHLAAELTRRLDAASIRDLVSRYARAITHGPTRPHRHLLAAGRFARVLFAAEAFRDRLLDVLDGRPAPRLALVQPELLGHAATGDGGSRGRAAGAADGQR